jgi:hypothetical protein
MSINNNIQIAIPATVSRNIIQNSMSTSLSAGSDYDDDHVSVNSDHLKAASPKSPIKNYM